MLSSPKNHSSFNSPPSNGPASRSQASQELQSPTNSQPESQQKQQSQPVNPWSAYTHTYSRSRFIRYGHTLSTSATVGDQLFLFGGYAHSSPSNDLYVISTRDLTTDLLQTSGEVPSPRFGHHAVLIGTTLLIWGGKTDFSDKNAQNQSNDDSFYLLNLVSRKWTRIVINGPGPSGRSHHTMTLVGSKLFVIGGKSDKEGFNDIWALDLNCLQSNLSWESYDPAPGSERPLPRAGHVSVTTGDRIIIFGGRHSLHDLNDTWSFNISTRKWTELLCTGSIPSPRAGHAAVLVNGVMYVFGGLTLDELCGLTAFDLSTQRWTAFQDMGPSPRGRICHAMACDGRRVFVLGGICSEDTQVDEVEVIHVLDTRLLIFPKPDSDTVKYSEKTILFTQKLSADHSTRGQPHQPSSSPDAHAAHDASYQKATTGASGRPRCVPVEDDDGEGSTEHRPKLVAPDARFGKEIRRLSELVSEMRVVKTEQDRLIAQLTDQLMQKSDLLEKAEADEAEEKKRAGLELRKLQAKLDELMLPHDHRLGHAQSALDEVAFRALLEEAETNAAEAEKRAAQELRELQAKRTGLALRELQAKRARLVPRELHAWLAGPELRERQAKLATEANERSQEELEEVHAMLEARVSELTAVRSRLTDVEDGWAKNRAEADTLRSRTQARAGFVHMRRLMECVRLAVINYPPWLYITPVFIVLLAMLCCRTPLKRTVSYAIVQ